MADMHSFNKYKYFPSVCQALCYVLGVQMVNNTLVCVLMKGSV